MSWKFIKHWRSGKDHFLDGIITADDTWLHYSNGVQMCMTSEWSATLSVFSIMECILKKSNRRDITITVSECSIGVNVYILA